LESKLNETPMWLELKLSVRPLIGIVIILYWAAIIMLSVQPACFSKHLCY